ncbi:MAG: hypothetical protein PVF83_18860 [Anaerolineales bacterium]|jgi:SAM-dependent methyltransferase
MNNFTHPIATRLPGGNNYDNITIDIQNSFISQNEWLRKVNKIQYGGQSKIKNTIKMFLFSQLKKHGLYEPLIDSGFIKRWFSHFHGYWFNVLQGVAPFNITDFNYLRALYRSRLQNKHNKVLTWENNKNHLAIWQEPANIQAIFHYAYKYALNPMRCPSIMWKYLREGMRVLEYGCSMAPAYNTYRIFYNHIPVNWLLADIPNFPFHYARYVYGRDEGVEFQVISEEMFNDPLKNIHTNFDLIIIQEVFEHLHAPLHIAKYLIERLNVGGLFSFDYALTKGFGYDTPISVEQRQDTLKFLEKHLKFIYGDYHNDEQKLGSYIGIKEI